MRRPVRAIVCGKQVAELAADPRLDVRQYASLVEFLAKSALFSAEEQPELIVVVQVHPDQFSSVQIDQLFSRYPLSRVLCAFGPLCESDGRTRNLWPQSVRIPLWKLHQRVEKELAVLAGNAPALPITATREETVHFEFEPLKNLSSRDGENAVKQLVVFSPDATWAELVVDSWSLVSQSPCRQIHTLEGLSAFLEYESDFNGDIILDIDPYNQVVKDWLRVRQQQSGGDILSFSSASEAPGPGGQIVAVSNWLISHRRKELLQLGVSCYVCKLNLPETLRCLSE